MYIYCICRTYSRGMYRIFLSGTDKILRGQNFFIGGRITPEWREENLLIILKNVIGHYIYFFYVKALKYLLFVSNQVTLYFSCQVFLLSSINLPSKINILKPFTWKVLFNSFRNCKDTKKIKSFKTRQCCPPTPSQLYLV